MDVVIVDGVFGTIHFTVSTKVFFVFDVFVIAVNVGGGVAVVVAVLWSVLLAFLLVFMSILLLAFYCLCGFRVGRCCT